MSRSGYNEDGDGDNWSLICWRGAVNSAIKGKRGQAMLRDLLAALDAMPDKRLVAGDLEVDGQFCALGVLGQARNLTLASIDTYDWGALGTNFNVAEALAREIMWINDESVRTHEYVATGEPYTNEWKRVEVTNAPLRRWEIVREWVENNITKEPA
jgi:hypothetical protein